MASTAKERLAQISHHFLTKEEAGTQHSFKAYVVAVMNDLQHCMGLAPLALAQALQSRDRVTAILHTEGQPYISYGLASKDDGLSWQLKPSELIDTDAWLKAIGMSVSPELILMPISSSKSPVIDYCDVVVLSVHASKVGVCDAYQHIKRLAIRNKSQRIGVTIINAQDLESAQYFYSSLAEVALRFLDISLVSYSYLSAIAYRPCGNSSVCDMQSQEDKDNLGNIAYLIEEDYQTYCSQPDKVAKKR